MFFIPDYNIAEAWKTLLQQGNITNKFIGLLHIMKLVSKDESIKALHQYQFNASQLSESLQSCLFFGTPKTYNNAEKYWVCFSKNWREVAFSIFIRNNVNIDIYELAIVCLNDYEFEKQSITKGEIINIFRVVFKIDNIAMNMWFYSANGLEEKIELGNKQDRKKLREKIVKTSGFSDNGNETLGLEVANSTFLLNSNAGELSRAPFFQTLYANQTSLQCLLCTKFDFFSEYSLLEKTKKLNGITPTLDKPQTQILFGSPGTGKSYKTRELTQGKVSSTTTFHPEYDYASFVGAYKPTSEGETISYQFVPQVFTKAYIAAWKNLASPHILVIEEINRGNCAAIFGDIFQLLDRDEQGFSEYFIDIDADVASYLQSELGADYEAYIKDLYFAKKEVFPENAFAVMCLPNNLSLLATMNTSDQSLFPMDSAFKRRWEWEYLPIDYGKAETIGIQIGDKKYSWADFLRKVNHKIYQITESEDKQIGVWFAKPKENIISEAQFLNKVMFYLWFDVFKNEDNTNQFYIFKIAESQPFKYADLFSKPELITQFLDYHQIQALTA